MKTQFVVLLIVLLCSAAFFSQGQGRPWLEDEELQHFVHPPISYDPKVAKCSEDFLSEKKCMMLRLMLLFN